VGEWSAAAEDEETYNEDIGILTTEAIVGFFVMLIVVPPVGEWSDVSEGKEYCKRGVVVILTVAPHVGEWLSVTENEESCKWEVFENAVAPFSWASRLLDI